MRPSLPVISLFVTRRNVFGRWSVLIGRAQHLAKKQKQRRKKERKNESKENEQEMRDSALSCVGTDPARSTKVDKIRKCFSFLGDFSANRVN